MLILLNVPAPALEAKVTVLCVPSLLIYTLNVPDLPTAGHAESVKVTSAPTVNDWWCPFEKFMFWLVFTVPPEKYPSLLFISSAF